MKKLFVYFTIIITVIIFAACQKELQFEPIPNTGLAVGTLQSTSGNCLPKNVAGVYAKDTVLKTTNYIDVTANITTIGNYIIKTDTIAGFSFIGIGTVTSTGINTIKLIGEGTPTSVGLKTFTVKFDTSICKVDVNVIAQSASTAVFVFNCAPPVLSGPAYNVGVAVVPLNTVQLNLTVSSPGLYTTNSGVAINGLTFSASGSFNGTGSNVVIFTASGTPTAAGTFNYTVTYGASSCTFPITVAAPPPAPNLDYVPQTSFSNWSNKITATTPPNPDTTYLQVSANSSTLGANTYKIFERKVQGTPNDSLFFRKNGGMYYQYIDGNLGVLTNNINKEYLILDSNLAVNSTWTVHFGPNVAQGFPLDDIYLNAKIISKSTTETVQSISYPNVIKVTYDYFAVVFGIPTAVATEERWYAKGIGIIKSNVNIIVQASGNVTTELTRSQIF